jgi:hypothetical protein
MKAPIRAVLSAALKEVATRTTEQKLSDHTCEYFFPNFFFVRWCFWEENSLQKFSN